MANEVTLSYRPDSNPLTQVTYIRVREYQFEVKCRKDKGQTEGQWMFEFSRRHTGQKLMKVLDTYRAGDMHEAIVWGLQLAFAYKEVPPRTNKKDWE